MDSKWQSLRSRAGAFFKGRQVEGAGVRYPQRDGQKRGENVEMDKGRAQIK